MQESNALTEEQEDYLETLSDSYYDLESLETDIQNNNFTPYESDPEPYSKYNIVEASIINGQHKQAQEQADRFGLNYGVILANFEKKGCDCG